MLRWLPSPRRFSQLTPRPQRYCSAMAIARGQLAHQQSPGTFSAWQVWAAHPEEAHTALHQREWVRSRQTRRVLWGRPVDSARQCPPLPTQQRRHCEGASDYCDAAQKTVYWRQRRRCAAPSMLAMVVVERGHELHLLLCDCEDRRRAKYPRQAHVHALTPAAAR